MKAFIAIAVVLLVAGAWFFRGAIFPSGGPPTSEETATTTSSVLTYASSTLGLSVSYPSTLTLNPAYSFAFSATKSINGASFTIPASMATGTNLSSDTRVSVEVLPRAKKCSADIFMVDNVVARNVVDAGKTYSFASSTGAGAGNRYEEMVYAFPNSSPCVAMRYYIHSTALENYEPGAVREFDRAALVALFDTIRRSAVFTSASLPAATSTATTSAQ